MTPRLLFYCQHSLGLGHFVRSLALAEALAARFEVVFFNGGPVPMAMELPQAIRFVHLPPLRMEEDGTLSGEGEVDAILTARSTAMQAIAAERHVAALVVELYPFGRKKFAAEIEPLIESIRAGGGKVVCSVRDILVNQRADQSRHDQRAADTLERCFDAVLVHADSRLSRLEDSFRPKRPTAIAVHHTGFVARHGSDAGTMGNATLVTAGGGIVGGPLYHAALAAQPRLWAERGWPMVILGGPLLPEADWDALCTAAAPDCGITLVRAAPSIAGLLRLAGRVVSQCGYNSALEILASGRPTLFVPFARGQESEQTMRARQFADLGLAQWLPETGLGGNVLAEALLTLKAPESGFALDTQGAPTSARIVAELAL